MYIFIQVGICLKICLLRPRRCDTSKDTGKLLGVARKGFQLQEAKEYLVMLRDQTC